MRIDKKNNLSNEQKYNKINQKIKNIRDNEIVNNMVDAIGTSNNPKIREFFELYMGERKYFIIIIFTYKKIK